MNQKMTISELRTFIQEQALKLYAIHILEERKAKIEKILNESAETEELSLEQQVYDEIEMRMRPTDDSLPYSEINEIAEMYGMDFEGVLGIMQNFLINRAQEAEEDLEFGAQETLNSLHGQGNENPSFSEFLEKFNELENNYNHSVESIKAEFDRLTKDPNQLSLFEKMIREVLQGKYS
jgi:hypothetical protein